MKKLLALAALGAAALALTSTAFADHAWADYHWARTSNPFTLKVGDNVSSKWDPFLDEAIGDWSASDVVKLTKDSGRTRPKNCRPTTGRIEACNARYGSTGWLGIAQIWANGSHITQAITKLNDTYFDTPTYNSAAWRRLVMCQELAHDFGLDHQDENFSNPNLGTCMDYTNSPAGNEHPNAHDFEQIAAIYAHLDSSTTASQGTLPGNAKPFSQANRANGSVYVDHLPGGVTLLTHVFWTPDGS